MGMRLFALASGLAVCGAALGAAPSEFDAMDANGDGRISAGEHALAAASMFKAMDADGDGRVTAAEMDAKAAPGALTSAEKIAAVDADGDGVLTAREHADASRAMFLTLDRNKDGSVSRTELDAGHAALRRK